MELEKVVQLIASLCKPEFENLSTPIKHQIVLISRHNIEREQKELDDFEKIVCRRSLEKYVHEVFYDSNACLCCFEFSKEVEKFSPLAGEFFDIAIETISQFEWFGGVYHGKPHNQ